jgi:hypothetical protein
MHFRVNYLIRKQKNKLKQFYDKTMQEHIKHNLENNHIALWDVLKES